MSDTADIKADLRDLSMIESGSADAVAAIHVLEHFAAYEAEAVLREWTRILKPGGALILELPCLNKIFGYIAWCVTNSQPMLPFMTLRAIYGDPREPADGMGHKFGWFMETLMSMLAEIGMKDIKAEPPRYHFQFRDMRMVCVK